MKALLNLCAGCAFFSALLLCSRAIDIPPLSLHPELPADVPMNADAGSIGELRIMVQLADGEDLPLAVDTGTSATILDKSLESKLGNPVAKMRSRRWGVITTNNLYLAPKLYLGGAPLLITGTAIVTMDCKSMSADANHPIMGILGMDVLEHYCVQLDFATGKMRFLDAKRMDTNDRGKAFPIVPLNAKDERPSVAENLLGQQGPHSLIDSGCASDGWLMPDNYRQWTNQAVQPVEGQAREPNGWWGGEKYPFVSLSWEAVESDGIGLRFLARHLVTLDFPNHTLYLKRQSIGPLPDPRIKSTHMKALDPLIGAIMLNDTNAARSELLKLEASNVTPLTKIIAKSLMTTLSNQPKPAPVDVPPEITQLQLGNAQAEFAEVGWLEPSANRIPPNGEIQSPLLDSGKIYATGLFAHSPSRYAYDLGGKWKTLRGEAGLHTAFQFKAFGVVFSIKADGKEVFRSETIDDNRQVHYSIDLTGVRTLELLVDKAQDQNGGNWGLWLDPTLCRETVK